MVNRESTETNRWVALIVASMTSFLTPFMVSAVNIALPVIGDEFRMDAISLSWVATAYVLAAAIFLLPFGRLADIYGRKRIFTYGVIVFTIFSLLSGMSTSTPILISFRVLQGIGGAMIFGTGIAIVTSVFPAQERGKALGINVAAVYLGLSLGPFLGGFLTQNLGWRSVFLATVPLGLVATAFIFWKLKGEWAEAKGEKFDFIGSIIYGLAFIAIIYGLSLLPAVWAVWLVFAGILGILAFAKWEMRVKSPVFDMSLFRHNTIFALSNLAALINYSATFAVAFLLSLYLQYIKGLSPQNAGLVLASQPIVMVIVSPFAGRLSDRVEPRIIASIGMVLTWLGLLFFVFIAEETALWFIVVGLTVLGFGFALFSSPNTNAVMSSVDRRFYGVASATISMMRLIGNMLSMGVVTLMFATHIGRVQITPEYYGLFVESARVAFIFFTALCFAGIFASLARGKMRQG